MIVKMWGNTLKSDIVQMAHHGLWTADCGLYELVGAKLLLWPTNYVTAKWYLNKPDQVATIKAFDLCDDIYVTGDTMWSIDLPYVVIEGHKEEVKNKINSTPG